MPVSKFGDRFFIIAGPEEKRLKDYVSKAEPGGL